MRQKLTQHLLFMINSTQADHKELMEHLANSLQWLWMLAILQEHQLCSILYLQVNSSQQVALLQVHKALQELQVQLIKILDANNLMNDLC